MQEKISVDLEILKKYSVSGPRYTSYPTVPHFNKSFTGKDFYQEIEKTNQKKISDISLYFHFPFCPSLCYYCGCNAIITRSNKRIKEYLQALKTEIASISSLLHKERKVVSMHWGGGSPGFTPLAFIQEMFRFIDNQFSFSNSAEISIELDPRQLSPKHLITLKELGFNRISFGVQDLDPLVQRTVNRIQPEPLIRQSIEESRKLEFSSINLDLIYGLPHQTLDGFAKTIEKVIEYSPDRLAIFNYAHIPALKKHQKLISEAVLPDSETKLRIFKMAVEKLNEAGYRYIGMDHFAKEDDSLTKALDSHTLYRNFQGYNTKKGVDVYALGVSSISQLQNSYAQNAKDTSQYLQLLKKGQIPTIAGYILTPDDQIRRHVIMELMCNNYIDKNKLERLFKINFNSYFAKELENLSVFNEDNLISQDFQCIKVSPMGRLVIRNIAMVFDKYLGKNTSQAMYSRTI